MGSEVQVLPGPPLGLVVLLRHASAKQTRVPNPPEGPPPGGAVPGVGRLLPESGDVAQLGEHLLCKQGVVGSSPIVSTILGIRGVEVVDLCLR